MRYVVGIAAVTALFTSLSAYSADAKDCTDVELTWGTRCNTSNSLVLTTTNNCGTNIYIKTCLEQANGRWDCGSQNNLRPGQTSSYYTCQATGKYERAACTGGPTECGFQMP